MKRAIPVRLRRTACRSSLHAGCAAWLLTVAGTAPAQEPWPLAGRQGMIQFVIVPMASAVDRQAYERQIERLCGAQETCFVNFYTNSKNAPLGVPLADEIFQESTATLRRSGKQQVDAFRWSCRVAPGEANCF